MNLKDKKGSISIFVLVALLFMSAFLIISFGANVNKSKTAKEQFNIISGIYSYGGGNEGAYDKAYTDLRAKNKQTMTATSETSSLELTKTYADKMSNLKIYGNSVQNGTPTSSNPVEVQSVGKMVNIFDKSQALIEGIKNETEVSVWAKEVLDNNWVINNLKPSTTYTISYDVEGIDVPEHDSEAQKNLGFYLYSTKTYAGVGTLQTEYVKEGEKVSFSRTFTTPEDLWSSELQYKVFVYTNRYLKDGSSVLGTMKFSNVQIEEGSQATEYVPYGKYRIPVKITGVNRARVNDGQLGNIYRVIYAIPVKEAQTITYIVNYTNNSSDSNHNLEARLYSDESLTTQIESFGVINSGNDVVKTITMTSDGYFTFCFGYGYTTIEVNKMFVGFGEFTIEDYKPYTEQTFNIYLDEPLRKVGDTADYIDFKTRKVIRNILEVNLKDLGWTMGGSTFSDNQLYISTGASAPTHSTTLSNYFIYNATIWSNNIIGIDGYYNGTPRIKVRAPYLTTENFTNFINTTDVKAYIINITEEVIEENVSLPELNTYEDYTKIEVLTDVAPSKIETEYVGYTLD